VSQSPNSDEQPQPGEAERSEPPAKVTWLQVATSTIAAAFGVQKKTNKERDFQHGRPLHFIVAGLVFTLVFVLAVYGVVQLVLRLAA
jgi:hypothetical protein